MNLEQAIIFLLVVCAVVLVIVFAKNKVEILVNVVLRVIFGSVSLHVLNVLLLAKGIDILVGINFGTLGVIGVLGIPGFILLYAVAFFKFI